MSNDSKIHFKIASTVNLSRQPCDSYVERLNGRQRAKGNDLGIQENNLRLMSKSDSAPEQSLQNILRARYPSMVAKVLRAKQYALHLHPAYRGSHGFKVIFYKDRK